MSRLTIYPDDRAEPIAEYRDFEAIADQLDAIGVQFERWQADRTLTGDSTQEEILDAYRESVQRLKELYGFQSADVINMTPDHPDKEALRKKFLDEHTHADFEVRFFVDGKGLFYIHADGRVYAVLCERGDLISVPAHATHWFDMGSQPFFKCIRLFSTPEGWVANFTGSDIARRFPTLD